MRVKVEALEYPRKFKCSANSDSVMLINTIKKANQHFSCTLTEVTKPWDFNSAVNKKYELEVNLDDIEYIHTDVIIITKTSKSLFKLLHWSKESTNALSFNSYESINSYLNSL